METKDVKKLIADLMEMMEQSKLTEMEVELEGTRVCLRREGSEQEQNREEKIDGPEEAVESELLPALDMSEVGLIDLTA